MYTLYWLYNLEQHSRQYSTYFPVELFYLQVVSCFNATSSMIGRPNSNDLHGQNTNQTRANYISVQIINYILLPRLNGNIMVWANMATAKMRSGYRTVKTAPEQSALTYRQELIYLSMLFCLCCCVSGLVVCCQSNVSPSESWSESDKTRKNYHKHDITSADN